MPTIPLTLPDHDSPDGLSLATLTTLATDRKQTVEQYINTTLAYANGQLPTYPDIEEYTAGLRQAGVPEIDALPLKKLLGDVS